MPPTAKLPCSVCGETGDGAHFGAEACRACAAFFRRSVALQKAYNCRSGGACEIQASVRCMCRACRFEKCLRVGMKRTAVQRHRDMLGKRPNDIDFDGQLHKSESDCPSLEQCYLGEDQGMPTLRKLQSNYGQMDSVRKVLHNREGDSVFTARAARAIAYKEANEINVKEIGLVADFLVNSFPSFASLPSDQKKLLYRNFFLSFMLLETGYFCSVNNRTDIIILPSGDYIDTGHPETFYHDIDGQQTMTTEDAVRLFSPSFEIYRRNILDPMRMQKVNDIEFFALSSFVLWDHGLEGQSPECEAVAVQVRDEVTRELIYYYRCVLRETDYAARMTSLLVLLPSLQRAVRRFQEDVEISHVFNVYSIDDTFYEIVNGRF